MNEILQYGHGNSLKHFQMMFTILVSTTVCVCVCPGFAVNLQLLLDHPEARIDPNAARGHLETSLLEQLVTLDQLEPRGDNCSKVTLSHLHTLTHTHTPSPGSRVAHED